MNIFSYLDTSDNEDEGQKQKQKVASNASGPKKQSTNKSGQDGKTETKPTQKVTSEKTSEKKGSQPVEADVAKDNNRGGKPRGKEGGKRGDKSQKHNSQEGEAPRRPKREFERRSGTGRGRELSRGGRGPFGLGNVNQEALDAEKSPEVVKSADEEIKQEAAADAESPVDAEAAEPEPVASVFTLDEYLSKRGSSSVVQAFKNISLKEEAKQDPKNNGKNQILDLGFKFETVVTESKGPRRREDDRKGKFANKPAKASGGKGIVINANDFPSL